MRIKIRNGEVLEGVLAQHGSQSAKILSPGPCRTRQHAQAENRAHPPKISNCVRWERTARPWRINALKCGHIFTEQEVLSQKMAEHKSPLPQLQFDDAVTWSRLSNECDRLCGKQPKC